MDIMTDAFEQLVNKLHSVRSRKNVEKNVEKMSDDDLKRILEEVQNIKLSEWKCKEENLLAGAFTFSDCNKRGLLRPLINQ